MKMKLLFPVLFFLFVITSCHKVITDITPLPSAAAARTIMDTSYGVDARQKMDIYLPASRTTATTKVLILIHGGGWTSGDKADFALIIDTLKKRLPDYAIFNINYRLAAWPANLFPTQEQDVKAAVEFIYGNRATFLVGDKFVMMGASAGGHLALLHAYKYTSPVKVKAVVDFFGPTDMADLYNNPGTVNPLVIAALMSGTPTSNPALYQQSSPLTYATAALACPTIILQGATDPLVNATRQSIALRDKLTSAGIINQYVGYPGGHGDWDAATYTDAYNKISLFLAANVP